MACTEHGTAVRELGKGLYFGELALLYSAPRSATVTSVTGVTLLSIGQETLMEVLGHSLEQIIYKNLLWMVLEQSPVLQLLGAAQAEVVLERVRIVTYHDDEVVVSQGTPKNAGVYIVLRGALKDKSSRHEVCAAALETLVRPRKTK